jgi:EmrB/QacA subfamily drug resistance transporter
MTEKKTSTSESKYTLLVVVLGVFMVAVDTTVVVLAIPTIGKELSANLSLSTWVLLSYLLVTAIFATQLGRIGDLLGRNIIYNSGFALFTLGSALCGLSFDIYELIAFRILQAVGGSMILANGAAVIADNFPRNSIGKAFGYTALGWNIGATLGIILGGLITSIFGWRYIFLINIPVGIFATSLGFKVIKANIKTESRLDIPGFLILSLSLTLLVLGSAFLAAYGPSIYNNSTIYLALVLLVPFIIVEKRSKSPILKVDLFKERILTYSLLSSFFQSVGYLSVSFLITIYLQGVRGLDPLQTSLVLLPAYLVSGVVAPFAGRLSDKYGSRILATAGMAVLLLSAILYIAIGKTTPLQTIVLASTLGGLGSALFFPANNSAIMANARPAYYGAISGLTRTLANIGTLVSYILAITVSSIAIPRDLAFKVFLGTSNLVGGLSSDFVVGLRYAFTICALILFFGLILSSLRGKEVRGTAT